MHHLIKGCFWEELNQTCYQFTIVPKNWANESEMNIVCIPSEPVDFYEAISFTLSTAVCRKMGQTWSKSRKVTVIYVSCIEYRCCQFVWDLSWNPRSLSHLPFKSVIRLSWTDLLLIYCWFSCEPPATIVLSLFAFLWPSFQNFCPLPDSLFLLLFVLLVLFGWLSFCSSCRFFLNQCLNMLRCVLKLVWSWHCAFLDMCTQLI